MRPPSKHIATFYLRRATAIIPTIPNPKKSRRLRSIDRTNQSCCQQSGPHETQKVLRRPRRRAEPLLEYIISHQAREYRRHQNCEHGK